MNLIKAVLQYLTRAIARTITKDKYNLFEGLTIKTYEKDYETSVAVPLDECVLFSYESQNPNNSTTT